MMMIIRITMMTNIVTMEMTKESSTGVLDRQTGSQRGQLGQRERELHQQL